MSERNYVGFFDITAFEISVKIAPKLPPWSRDSLYFFILGKRVDTTLKLFLIYADNETSHIQGMFPIVYKSLSYIFEMLEY